jgi:hypothetical protein
MRGRNSPPLRRDSERPTLRRLLAGALTAALHVVVLAVFLWPRATPPRARVEPPPLQVSMVELPRPKPPAPPDMTKFETAQSAPRHLTAPIFVIARNTPDTSDLLSESQLSGAAIAGNGGGGSCDMARAVQQALRRDPMVRAAVDDAHRTGMAVMLWDGDWVRSGDQDGKGMSAVREAVMWEVAFAPESCRNARMHGLVLLSLADGRTRFALGTGDWRWSDLLGVRGREAAR